MLTTSAASVTYRFSSLSPYSWRRGGMVNSLSFSFKLFFFGTFFFSLFSFFSYQTQTHFRNRHSPKTTSNFRMPHLPRISRPTSAAYYTHTQHRRLYYLLFCISVLLVSGIIYNHPIFRYKYFQVFQGYMPL